MLAERVAGHQVDLVAVGIGVANSERSGRLTRTYLVDTGCRPHDVEVDAVAERPQLGRVPDPQWRVAVRKGSITSPSFVSYPRSGCQNPLTAVGFDDSNTTLRCCSAEGFATSPRSRAAAEIDGACSSASRRTRVPVVRTSTTICDDRSTMRPASAAPSISDGASNQAVLTPSTTRQSVPMSVMRRTVPLSIDV